MRQIRVVFDLLQDQLALGTEAAALLRVTELLSNRLPFPAVCIVSVLGFRFTV